jgi:hypothetical protein
LFQLLLFAKFHQEGKAFICLSCTKSHHPFARAAPSKQAVMQFNDDKTTVIVNWNPEIVILSGAAFQAQRRISSSTGPTRKRNATTTEAQPGRSQALIC